MKKLENKIALITGSTSGIGAAIARKFSEQGATVIVCGRSAEAGNAVADTLQRDGGKATCFAADIADEGQVKDLVDAVISRFGQIDILAAIAGGFHMGESVHSLPSDKWDLMMDLNARTLLNSIAAVVPTMIENSSGKIVTIGANAAREGIANMGAYIAAKSAVLRLTETMSSELRGNGVNVNCVMPSIIDTPENRRALPAADPNNWVSPEKLANVILFLCSEDSSAVHGACIPVVGLC